MSRDRVRGWTRRCAAAALAGAVGLLLLVPSTTPGQRIGLFFDPAATLCEAPLVGLFDSVRVYVVGFPPADSLLGGALLSVELPPLVEIWPGTFRMRRDVVFDIVGDVANLRDLDVRFRGCVDTNEPLPLMEFVIYQGSDAPRSNLRLRLTGAAVDSLSLLYPAWKFCDPADPEHFVGYVSAPSVDALLNCTVGCYCTTAVGHATWSAIKSLYQGN